MPKRREHYYDGDTLIIKCPKCEEMKPADAFPKHSKKTFGVGVYCKDCSNKLSKEYYYKNDEAVCAHHKEYRAANGERWKEIQSKSYRKHREKYIQQVKDNINRKKEDLGFNRSTFHQKAHSLVAELNNLPTECAVCREEKKLVAHHPSYESFDKRKEVVLVCPTCHREIHHGIVECPEPIDLVQLASQDE